MEAEEFVETRRRRYLAQLLDDFDRNIEPLLPPGHDEAVTRFKAHTRQKLQSFAEDARDMLTMDSDTRINALAVAIADHLKG